MLNLIAEINIIPYNRTMLLYQYTKGRMDNNISHDPKSIE